MGRTALLLCIMAAVLSVAGFLTLGIAGSIMLRAVEPLIKQVGVSVACCDSRWQAEIDISIIGPFAWPLSYLGAALLVASPLARTGMTIILAIVANVILAVVVAVVTGSRA